MTYSRLIALLGVYNASDSRHDAMHAFAPSLGPEHDKLPEHRAAGMAKLRLHDHLFTPTLVVPSAEVPVLPTRPSAADGESSTTLPPIDHYTRYCCD